MVATSAIGTGGDPNEASYFVRYNQAEGDPDIVLTQGIGSYGELHLSCDGPSKEARVIFNRAGATAPGILAITRDNLSSATPLDKSNQLGSALRSNGPDEFPSTEGNQGSEFTFFSQPSRIGPGARYQFRAGLTKSGSTLICRWLVERELFTSEAGLQ
jgi:hypothetical protein